MLSADAAGSGTPALSTGRYLHRPTPDTDLVAPALQTMPNALSADFWLARCQQELDRGDAEVSGLHVFCMTLLVSGLRLA